jgi:hypothetical protein
MITSVLIKGCTHNAVGRIRCNTITRTNIGLKKRRYELCHEIVECRISDCTMRWLGQSRYGLSWNGKSSRVKDGIQGLFDYL